LRSFSNQEKNKILIFTLSRTYFYPKIVNKKGNNPMRILHILTILIILALVSLSCRSSGNFNLGRGASELPLYEWLVADYISEIGEIDNNAEIFIVSQIPFRVFNLFDPSDIIDITVSQTIWRALRVEVPQDFFFNSILAANQISEFARENPASTRGIFGDLLGITEVANETQNVIFGILPRTARIFDFRFETYVEGVDEMLKHLTWQYNSRFDVSFAENQINMIRRPQVSDGSRAISYRFVESSDRVLTLGSKENLDMLLFKRSDLAYVRSRLRNFRISEFERIKVSVFINPFLMSEIGEDLAELLKNTEIYNNLNYELSVFQHEKSEGENYPVRDSIVIIYDKNNPIAFETAKLLGDDIRHRLKRKVGVFADTNQQRQFFFDYDIAISAHSVSADPIYLSRRFFGRELSEEEIRDRYLKTDLFEMRTFLLSSRKIVRGRYGQYIISNLEVAK